VVAAHGVTTVTPDPQNPPVGHLPDWPATLLYTEVYGPGLSFPPPQIKPEAHLSVAYS